MFRSGLERGLGAAIPSAIKRQTVGDGTTSHTTNPFALPTEVQPANARKAKDPLRAAWAAKGLGRRATLALPDVPDAPTWNTVLTAASDHLRQATYSPFDYCHSTTLKAITSTRV